MFYIKKRKRKEKKNTKRFPSHTEVNIRYRIALISPINKYLNDLDGPRNDDKRVCV